MIMFARNDRGPVSLLWLSSMLLLLSHSTTSGAFAPPTTCLKKAVSRSTSSSSSITRLHYNSNKQKQQSPNAANNNPNNKKHFTLKDLREEMEKKPTAFLDAPKKKKSNYRRSRKRAEHPQQQYLYAKQRKALERQGAQTTTTTGTRSGGEQEGGADDTATAVTSIEQQQQQSLPVALARELGVTHPAAQHCDCLVDEEPTIVGQLRVVDADATTSGSYAYVIHKPAGWAILGGGGAATKKTSNSRSEPSSSSASSSSASLSPRTSKSKQQQITRLEITDVDGSKDALEFSQHDLLAAMTAEEIEEYQLESQGSSIGMSSAGEQQQQKPQAAKITKKVKVRADVSGDDDDDAEDDEEYIDDIDLEERELLAELTPEELAEYEREVGPIEPDLKRELTEMHAAPPQETMVAEEEQQEVASSGSSGHDENTKKVVVQSKSKSNANNDKPLDPKTQEVYSKIEARKSAAKSNAASFSPVSRPSVVAWLKELKAQEGNPMKGGKYWTALAGATNVDDSGIVIVCPKEYVDNVFVDYLEYVAVVGNDNYLAPKQKGVESIPKEEMTMEILSAVRRGRADDSVQTVKVMVQETFSSCSSIIQSCQGQFQDGIRGDPAGNPLGRLANRRLVHCNAVSASSLVHDESVEVETQGVPDDIAILAERRNQHEFKQGSFLGRSALRDNPLTTAYREINGAADGFPGWTVDRYDKWLFVQHDDKMPKGPLPSIHDGQTLGVYYLPANPNRSAMGSSPGADKTLTRPQLSEGQPAPDTISILENGITYQVSLDKDLSTGIFLDQRPQRAWLARNCNEDTHVLNCFAHCGGFSIAAATAGASTTSVDLNKKWLDRVEPQLQANGVDFDIRHDCIYGDCFDWLAKLAKRGEKYDIVILDPPSASVGGKKKKRWSIKNDMPELVALAAQVVKKGGLLWTTTNSASVNPVKFAKLCQRGLEDAGLGAAKLERIQPMPHDFPSIGPQPVKNYVWRLP